MFSFSFNGQYMHIIHVCKIMQMRKEKGFRLDAEDRQKENSLLLYIGKGRESNPAWRPLCSVHSVGRVIIRSFFPFF